VIHLPHYPHFKFITASTMLLPSPRLPPFSSRQPTHCDRLPRSDASSEPTSLRSARATLKRSSPSSLRHSPILLVTEHRYYSHRHQKRLPVGLLGLLVQSPCVVRTCLAPSPAFMSIKHKNTQDATLHLEREATKPHTDPKTIRLYALRFSARRSGIHAQHLQLTTVWAMRACCTPLCPGKDSKPPRRSRSMIASWRRK
jgi:hypothetical protein